MKGMNKSTHKNFVEGSIEENEYCKRNKIEPFDEYLKRTKEAKYGKLPLWK